MLPERSNNSADRKSSRFLEAVGLFDRANSEDPNLEVTGYRVLAI